MSRLELGAIFRLRRSDAECSIQRTERGESPPRNETSKQTNYDTARGWLSNCVTAEMPETVDNDQDQDPATSHPTNATMDLYLLDIHDHRLVKAHPTCRYIALSYVWGGVEVFQTMRSNPAGLEQPGGLLPHLSQIPLVIRDAIEFVAQAGE